MSIQDLIDSISTKETDDLLKEAEKLHDSSLVFKEMTDSFYLKHSDGGATYVDSKGNEVICLDPKRANEYLLAHELMHSILHNSGYPQIRTIIENDLKKVVNGFDNCFDHYMFYPRLQKTIDVSSYTNKFSSDLKGWKHKEKENLEMLHNAFLILDYFSLDIADITILKNFEGNYPKTLDLARNLDRIRKDNSKDKMGIRRSMIDSTNLVNEFIVKKCKKKDLNDLIVVTPLFTEEEMSEQAFDIIKIQEPSLRTIDGKRTYIYSLVLRSDNSLIGGFTKNFKMSIKKLREEMKEKDLKTFLDQRKIPYGITDGVNPMEI